jgi:4'-phosphopantetheinyl transferase
MLDHGVRATIQPMSKASVDLWTVSLTTPVPDHLTEDEKVRANRFKFEEDRIRWTRARSSLRVILSRYAGDDPVRLAFVYGEHGKPALLPFSAIQFNLSHAGDWAMVAVTRSIPVGVDIERIRTNVDMAPLLHRLGETNLPEQTQQLYQVWTRREARSKAAGGALFDKPSDNIYAIDVTAPAGYAASVALVGFEPDVRYCGNGSR